VSEPKDKFTPELRLVAAALLSFLVLVLWTKYFGPKPPTTLPQGNRAAQTAPAIPGPATAAQTSAPANASTSPGTAAAISAAAPVNIAAKADSQERTIVIDNDLYRAEISNRGAVVKSWQLKKYMDDSNPQKVLDVVHPQAAEQTGGWPFSLALEDAQMEASANGGLYQISTSANVLNAPADAEFSWSDGHLEVSKHFHFDHSYVVRVETSVNYNGVPVTAGLAWRGGFGDLTVKDPIPLETVSTFYSEGGKLSNFGHKKLDGPEKWGNGIWQGGKDFTGIEDRYFTAVFLPANGATPGALETRYWKVFHTVQMDPKDASKDASEAVPEMATATAAHPTALRVYVGPKDYDDLKKMNPPLHSLVQFGWMEFVADPLFHAMKWVRTAIPNWGWTIIVLTLLINMLFFPLRISGYKSTVKMQRVAPEINAIKDLNTKVDTQQAEIDQRAKPLLGGAAGREPVAEPGQDPAHDRFGRHRDGRDQAEQ
jgi:YidC/Oxa1 family membrane protein insertase